jgi:hypothetical protein
LIEITQLVPGLSIGDADINDSLMKFFDASAQNSRGDFVKALGCRVASVWEGREQPKLARAGLELRLES